MDGRSLGQISRWGSLLPTPLPGSHRNQKPPPPTSRCLSRHHASPRLGRANSSAPGEDWSPRSQGAQDEDLLPPPHLAHPALQKGLLPHRLSRTHSLPGAQPLRCPATCGLSGLAGAPLPTHPPGPLGTSAAQTGTGPANPGREEGPLVPRLRPPLAPAETPRPRPLPPSRESPTPPAPARGSASRPPSQMPSPRPAC